MRSGVSMLTVNPVRAFADNYIWLIQGLKDTSRVVAVDPGDARPVVEALQREALSLAGILITHHHRDHTGGVEALVEKFQGVPVFGPARETIPALTRGLAEGDLVAFEDLGLRFQVQEVPGHTAGHIAYVGHGAVFCGDTLFSGGCGRLFEGTPAQMLGSLSRLSALPPDTLVYCTHEYTLSNLRFARVVDAGNAVTAAYEEECRQRRHREEPTLPSTIGRERNINPFLRCDREAVVRAAEQHVGRRLTTAVEVFSAVRQWKDQF